METIHIASGSKATIGEFVANDWRTTEVFKRHGIDFCCGGKRTVAEACQKKGIDPKQVEAELEEVARTGSSRQQNYNEWSLDFLVDYIVNNHHHYVKKATPFLDEISLKVARVHGDQHPELIEINHHVKEVIGELTMHMHKEEKVLFPYIKQLAEANSKGIKVAPPLFGTIANPISMMESEHTAAGISFEAIESLSNQFTPPADACTSYRVLFTKLKEFQHDLYQHIHLENNILFPKALALEEELPL